MIDETFDCPVAKRAVTWSTVVRNVRAGFPPVREFADCTGLSSCGVEKKNSTGATYNWQRCPKHRTLN